MRTHEKKLITELIVAMNNRDRETVDRILVPMGRSQLRQLVHELGLLYLNRVVKEIENGR